MNRRSFLRNIGVAATAIVAAPFVAKAAGAYDVLVLGPTKLEKLKVGTNFGELTASQRVAWSRDTWTAARDECFALRFIE